VNKRREGKQEVVVIDLGR